MYCRKCGMELDEGARFCENCGTPVAHEELDNRPIGKPSGGPAKSMDPKTKRNIIIATIIALIVIGGGVAALVASLADGYSAECKDKLETAQQYVEDGNLTDAEAAYLDIISIEPDKPTAYVELAEKVYAPQHRYTDAVNILREGEKNTGGSHKIDKSIEKVNQMQKEASEWMNAYRKLLEQNEFEIREYEYPTDEEGYLLDYWGDRKGTALCDFDKDNIPELLFYTYEDYEETLHIVTYSSGEAYELQYKWTPVAEKDYGREEYEQEGRLSMSQEVATSYFLVYKEKGVNGVSVHSLHYDEELSEETTNRYQMTSSREMDRIDIFSHSKEFDYIDSDEIEPEVEVRYISNDAGCSREQYEKLLNASVDGIETVLFRCLPYEEDEYSYMEEEGMHKTIWQSTEDKDISITYDEMIELLTVSVSAPEGETTDNNDQMHEEGKIMEQVLAAYSQRDFAKAEELNAQLPAEAEEMEVSDAEYQAYQGVYDDLYEQGALEDNPVSFITDIDKDGKSEYLIQTGHYEAEYMLQVYQYRDGKTNRVGEVGFGHCALSLYPDHNGIILSLAHMGYENLTIVSLENGKLKTKQLLDEPREDLEVEDYLPLGLSAMPLY